MARPPAACGTFSAYKRHKRLGEPVDADCQRAQRAQGSTQVVTLTPKVSSPLERRGAQEALIKATIVALVLAAGDDDWAKIIEHSVELDRQVEAWCDYADEVNAK